MEIHITPRIFGTKDDVLACTHIAKYIWKYPEFFFENILGYLLKQRQILPRLTGRLFLQRSFKIIGISGQIQSLRFVETGYLDSDAWKWCQSKSALTNLAEINWEVLNKDLLNFIDISVQIQVHKSTLLA